MMLSRLLLLGLALSLNTACAAAQDLSTHVLDLARGVGGAGVPVTLDVYHEGGWALVGRATTAENGRVESFEPVPEAPGVDGPALYRLTFDVAGYWSGVEMGEAGPPLPFFPEIVVVFRVEDPSAHTHVPVVVSPYGYSTYRGN